MVFDRLGSSDAGLSRAEAAVRLESFGANVCTRGAFFLILLGMSMIG